MKQAAETSFVHALTVDKSFDAINFTSHDIFIRVYKYYCSLIVERKSVCVCLWRVKWRERIACVLKQVYKKMTARIKVSKVK